MREIIASNRHPEIPPMDELRAHPAVITDYGAFVKSSDVAFCVLLAGAKGSRIMTDAIAEVRWPDGEDRSSRLPTASFLLSLAVESMPVGLECHNPAASLIEVQQRARALKALNVEAGGKVGVRTINVTHWGIKNNYRGPNFILDLSILDPLV